MNRYLKFIGWVLAGFVGFVILYLVVAISLSKVSVNNHQPQSSEVQIFVKSNGVHTDIVVPIKSDEFDWSRWIKKSHVKTVDSNYTFLAFGWGDRAFYLETPTWSDLTFRTAFNAAFGMGRSAMHATFYKVLNQNSTCRSIHLSKVQYANLIKYIQASFLVDDHGQFCHIKSHSGYGNTDAFYEAHGRYSMLHTCNTWTNNALKSCGQKACIWTPFDTGILDLYK